MILKQNAAERFQMMCAKIRFSKRIILLNLFVHNIIVRRPFSKGLYFLVQIVRKPLVKNTFVRILAW